MKIVKKLPFIIVGIVAFVAIIVGLIIILLSGSKKEKISQDLSVQYIGGDKFIGQSVTNEDFQVVYLPNNARLNPEAFLLENTLLSLNGTNVSILYTTPEGQMVSTQIMVYPTLKISGIKATLVNKNRYIGKTS